MAIKIIVTSTRPVRIGDEVASAIAPLIAEGSGKDVEIVDLRDLALPLLDEPEMPRMGNYVNAHTKNWAKIVSEADAVVWLTPEYNGSFTAATKNAIDTLFAEWENKPTGIVAYAFAGGQRVVPMLSTVLENVGNKLAEKPVQMAMTDFASETGIDVAGLVAKHADELRALGANLV